MEFGNAGRKPMDFTMGYIELGLLESFRTSADTRTNNVAMLKL